MKIKFLAEAEAELLEAVLWYEDRRVGLGLEFHENILDTCIAIENSPSRYPKYELLTLARDVRRAIVNRFPYVVIFELQEQEAVVLAIAHSSRETGYWLGRS